jgi:phosphopentomutase
LRPNGPSAATRRPSIRDALSPFARAIVIVLDSVGIGALPDAHIYGDEGSNTLGHIVERVPLQVPVMRSLGLDRLVRFSGDVSELPDGAYGRMAEASAGKDSVTGHWEMMGIVLEHPFPTFPSGFPRHLMADFERRIGRETIGNVVASGTEIINRLGEEHVRTANRHDYALQPTGTTLLDRLTAQNITVVAIGKIGDLFAGRGVTRMVPTTSDADGLNKLAAVMSDTASGFIFTNLVDSDTVYGHRNDIAGYAANLQRVDEGLGRILPTLRPADLLVVTADHGNDPSTPSTDHSREYVPLLLTGARVRAGVDIGTRATFADLGQTLAENFGVGPLAHGTSFLAQILEDGVVEHP